MSRQLNCISCGVYLGEIRDGTLKKGLVFMCADCASAMQQKRRRQRETDDMLPPEFKSIFGF